MASAGPAVEEELSARACLAGVGKNRHAGGKEGAPDDMLGVTMDEIDEKTTDEAGRTKRAKGGDTETPRKGDPPAELFPHSSSNAASYQRKRNERINIVRKKRR